MKISDIKIDERSELRDVACHTLGRIDIVLREGHVKYVGNNSYELITKDNVIPFSIDDVSNSKLVTDYISRHYYVLAEITSCSSNKDNGVLFIHFVFFCNCKRMGTMPLIISPDAMEYLFKLWKVERKEEKVYQRLQEQFEITNGADMCFLFESSEKSFKQKTQEEINDDEEDDEADSDDSESMKKRVLVLHGRSIKLYLFLRGKKFEEKL